MRDEDKTKAQLIEELNRLRQRVTALETAEASRNQAEQELREDELKYRTLYNNAPLPYQSLDENGNFIDVNSAWLEALGYNRENVIGKNFAEFLHPDWEQHFKENFPEFKRRGKIHDVQFKIRHKDGHYRDISFEGCIGYNPDGSFRQTYCVFKDITARKQIEAELRKNELLLSKSQAIAHVGSWEMDLDNNRLTWSDEVYRICGLNPQEIEITYTAFIEIVHPDDRDTVNNAYTQSLRNGDDTYEIEHRIIRQDNGAIRILHEKCEHIKDPTGRVVLSTGMVQDITERKQAEEALRESEERYRLLFNNAEVLISVYNYDGVCLLMNRKVAALFGGEPEDFIGKSFHELHRETAEEYIRRIQLAINSGTPQEYEDEVKFSEGKRWLVSSVHPVPDVNGVFRTAQIISQDFTKRKHAENALRENERLLRKIAENYPNSYLSIIERDFTIGFTSGQEFIKQGLNPEQFVGMTLEQVFGDKTDIIRENYEKTFAGEKCTFELSMNNQYQSYCTVPLYAEDGSIPRILSVVENITERKQAEEELYKTKERFRLAMEASKDGLWDVNVKAGEVYYSPSYAAMLGYKADEITPEVNVLQELVHPEDRDMVLKVTTDCIENHIDNFEIEYRIRAKNGEWRWILGRGKVVERDKSGRATRIIGTHTDITKQKQTEGALEKRILALTIPLDDTSHIDLEDLFNHEEIQRIQDEFAQATNVASIITHPDGVPITRPSNFCRLCNDIIRKTEKGRLNCYKSDAVIGRLSSDGPIVQPCMSGGLWDAGAAIAVGGKHIANWLIGQVRDETQTEEKMRAYARQIGADEEATVEAFREVPSMSRERFEQIAQMLFTFANQLSTMAYQTVQQARFITERKKAEKALQENEERLRSLINATPDIICFKDGQGRWLEANQADLELFQLEGVDYRGKTNKELAKYSEFYYDAFLTCEDSDELAWKGKTISRGEEVIPKPDGTTKVYDIIKIPLYQQDGERKGLVVLGRDVTERKKAEEERARLAAQLREQAQQMEQILATVPAGVLLLDAEGYVIQANPTAKEELALLSRTHADAPLTDLGDRSLAELLTSPPQGLWHEVKADGHIFEVIARCMEPVQDLENGNSHKPEDWVLVINDVTQERAIQDHVQQQERLAAVGQLAAGIAHDFNNILAVIVLYTQISLKTTELPPKTLQRLETVIQQAHRAAELIQQILDFSRRAVLERRPMDLKPFLKEIVKMLVRTVPEHIKIDLALGEGEYMINADPTRLQQAIVNLVVNARDAMPEGGALRIELGQIQVKDPKKSPLHQMGVGDWIRIAITDTGGGIPADVLPHIFEPFFTTKEAGQGTGLGLAQVYGIVKLHKGHIDVITKVEKGTTFVLYFPALLEPSAGKTSQEATTAYVQGHGETILLVEDNATLRTALTDSLELMNYRVLEAGNGYAALELLAQHAEEIALVLSDLVMPEMGGQALSHAMAERGIKIPIVVLSGHPMKNKLNSSQIPGLAGWMLKPPNMEQLSRLLAQAIRKEH